MILHTEPTILIAMQPKDRESMTSHRDVGPTLSPGL